MGIRVKLATTPDDLKSLTEVRHRVFVDEDGYLAPQGGRIVDFYDVLPTTSNVIALVNDEVVGGCRLTVDSTVGMPSDRFFDFRPHLPEGARPASGSMMCVLRSARMAPRLIQGILKMLFYRAYAAGCTHLVAPLNPRIRPILMRVGMKPVGEVFVDEKGLETLPMVADLADLSRGFNQFMQRQDVELWLDSFERAFFEDGEPILQEGTPGDEAFLLVGGRAEAVATDASGRVEVLQPFEIGDVFGELALLTERPRSATVRSIGATDAMVLRRADFHRQLETVPHLATTLLRDVGDRFHEAIRNRSPRSGKHDDSSAM
ncbi:MAG: cyclic nucleotide-binding domain-containing protein [Myxococcota bacterium]